MKVGEARKIRYPVVKEDYATLADGIVLPESKRLIPRVVAGQSSQLLAKLGFNPQRASRGRATRGEIAPEVSSRAN